LKTKLSYVAERIGEVN